MDEVIGGTHRLTPGASIVAGGITVVGGKDTADRAEEETPDPSRKKALIPKHETN